MTPTGIEVRRATIADLDTVTLLFDAYRQFYQQPGDLSAACTFLRDRLTRGESVIFLATEQGSSAGLGFTQLYPSFSSVAMRSIWILNDLFVIPEARRRGVGRALMETARLHAVETGAKRLTLATAPTNRPAQILYESLGYRRDEHFSQYAREL
jgi:ribosomal protein S18 acetylase RimI-like enzyme